MRAGAQPLPPSRALMDSTHPLRHRSVINRGRLRVDVKLSSSGDSVFRRFRLFFKPGSLEFCLAGHEEFLKRSSHSTVRQQWSLKATLGAPARQSFNTCSVWLPLVGTSCHIEMASSCQSANGSDVSILAGVADHLSQHQHELGELARVLRAARFSTSR